MNASNVDISTYAPHFEVDMNGRTLGAEVSKIISSITVEQDIDKTNNFRFVVQDEFNDGRFKWLGDDLFKYGNNVTVKLGYVGNAPRMLEGRIQNIAPSFFTGSAPTFTVEGTDKAYKFLLEKSEPNEFKDKSDSQIVKAIAAMAKLKADVDTTTPTFPVKKKKGGESYLKFIQGLVSGNENFEFYLSGQSLFFKKAKKDKKAQFTCKWGEELINFTPTLNTSQAVSEVVVRSWDRTGKKKIEVRVKAGEEKKQEKNKKAGSQIVKEIFGDVVKVITERPVRSEKEARRIALAELEKSSDSLVKGSGEIIGNPDIKPGICIYLDGLGKWFSGKYYVEKVSHVISGSGYRTKFDVRRNTL